MTTETLERLLVQFSADMRSYEKSLQKATGETTKRMREVQGRHEAAAGKIKQIWLGAGEGIAAALAGVTVGAVLAGVRSAAADLAQIGAEAKRAGVGVEAFQELGYAAQRSQVNIDGLTDGLKEMQLRADEFITTGAGSGAEAFQRLGLSAADLKQQLQDPAALFETIIDRLAQLDTASQIRIADEIFGGTGGEQFVRFLQQGVGYIAQSRQEARALGVVLDKELIGKAAEITRQFDALATVIGVNVKGAIISAVSAMGTFVDMLNKTEQQQISTLEARVASMQAAADNMEKSGLASLFGGGEAGLKRRREEIALLQAEINLRKEAANVTPATSDGWKPPTSMGDLSNVGKAEEMRKAYERLIATGQMRIEALNTETATIGMTTQAAEAFRLEQELLSAAQAQNITLTDAQRAAIKGVAEQYGAAAAAAEQASLSYQASVEKLDNIRDGIGDAVSTFNDGMQNGLSAADALTAALGRVLDRVQDIAIEAALSGLFGKPGTAETGILGKLLGFDSGGYTGDGPAKRTAGVVHRGEYVFSKPAVQRLGLGNLDALHRSGRSSRGYARGGPVGLPSIPKAESLAPRAGGMTITYAPQVSIAAGASPESVAELRRVLEEDRRSFAQRTVRVIRDAQRRNVGI